MKSLNSAQDLILLNLAGILPKEFNKLLGLYGNTKDILGDSKVRERVSKAKSQLDAELNLAQQHKIDVITIFDEGYPGLLKKIDDPPYILYMKGKVLAQDGIAIAIVGSRHCTHYGLSTAERLSRELASLGITIVSGAARGIDSASHRGALGVSGRTIAVLGSGLANIYPPENKKMLGQIEENGAVISEFPIKMPPYKANFPRRNRIISGLSLGVVVVEAAERSGALITADYALEQNREVFAVPGNVKAFSSLGTNRLIKEGAKLVGTRDDILEELDPEIRKYLNRTFSSADTDEKSTLNEQEKKIFSVLSQRPLYIDDVMDKSCLGNSVVLKTLLGLQIKGLVEQLPGNQFVKKEA